MFPEAALQERSILMPAAWRDPLLLSHAFSPILVWGVEGGIFLIPCLRYLRYPLGKERPWRIGRIWTITCTSSPICFLKMEPYLKANFTGVPSWEKGRGRNDTTEQQHLLFWWEKINKTPQVIRRWKWGRISICGAFPYPELKLFWFWVIAANQRSTKGDFFYFFFFRHIGDIEKETFSRLQGPRKRMGKGRGKSGPYGRNCC